jgi:hypothetical protein
MSFLMHLFSGNAKLAEELAKDEPLLEKSMESYFQSHEAKQRALGDFVAGKPFDQLIATFRLSLADELALIAGSEKEEKEILQEVESFNGRKEFERIKKTMDYAKSQDRFVYHLMKQLHALLTQEAHTLVAIQANPSAQLQQAFIDQLQLENLLAEELRKVDNLSYFFKNLALGERRRHELQKSERSFAETLYEEMLDHEIVDGRMRALNDRAITNLTVDCFNELEEEVMRAVDAGELEEHPNVPFEYVNSPGFEQFVHAQILKGKYDIGKDAERIFVCLFREFYNSRLET